MGKNRLVCKNRINFAGLGVPPNLTFSMRWAEIAIYRSARRECDNPTLILTVRILHVPQVHAHVQPIRAEKRQPRAGIVAQTCAANVHRLTRGKNAAVNEMKRQIHNPWAGGRMTVDAFWIDGGRRHCSVFVLGPFCSISHGSTLRRKGWTNPTIHSQVFVFVLARGGCGRGASALPLNASESSLTAR